MMSLISRVLARTGVCVMTSMTGGAPVTAQQSPSSAVDKTAVVLIPGVLTGPGTMGPRGYRRLCTPRSVGLYEWQVRWIERVVRPNETQRAALNDLQSASSKAIATMATACKAEAPAPTQPGLEMIDNRLQILSQALTSLHPAFTAVY